MTEKMTVLIAGATGNIGGGAALSLAKRGARVVILGRKQETLTRRANSIRNELTRNEIKHNENDIDTLVVDFSDMESVRSAACEAKDRFPNIDGLILSVVTYLRDGPTILPNGHERMFATNVMGPFLFTQLLIDRLERSNGMVLHVIAPFNEDIDWSDLESIINHRPEAAYHRTKTCNRIIASELARRYSGKISSVAFNPSFIIDKEDPELKKRWPKGFTGLYWNVLTMMIAKPPEVAGEPIADLVTKYHNREELNGALFKLEKRINKPDKAMKDEISGKKLWDLLVRMTNSPTHEKKCNYDKMGV